MLLAGASISDKWSVFHNIRHKKTPRPGGERGPNEVPSCQPYIRPLPRPRRAAGTRSRGKTRKIRAQPMALRNGLLSVALNIGGMFFDALPIVNTRCRSLCKVRPANQVIFSICVLVANILLDYLTVSALTVANSELLYDILVRETPEQ